MDESSKNAKPWLRGGAALVLALALLWSVSSLTVGAKAATLGEDTAPQYLVPVGHTVGIKLFSRGLLVVQLSDGQTPAKDCGLKTGDQILQCNGGAVDSTEDFQSMLQESGGDPVTLHVQRAGKTMDLTAEPEAGADGTYRLGAWVRDSMAGIGTVTFYDPQSGTFGALGHGITDVDTAQLMPLSQGAVMASRVKAVKKGETGAAGELRGDFDLTADLGTLNTNCDCGVFGTVPDGAFGEELGTALPVAKPEEVQEGKATILANVAGDTVEEYEVEITQVLSQEGNRNLLLTVTDPKLLETTGGIVQGMSGSPILQNGKFVGAVTHVLLNDPTSGYGIFLENMVEAAWGA